MSMKDNKAVLYVGSRSLQVKWLEVPQSRSNEILLKVSYCGICGTDLHIYQGHMDDRVKIPHVMGHEMSGKVINAPFGSGFQEGDSVVIEPTVFCGKCSVCRHGFTHICDSLNLLGVNAPGAFQQYCAIPVDRVHKIPDSLPDNLAAMVEPLAVAVHDVRRAGVKEEDKVVVIGGGPIGLLIALVSREIGAEVLILEINEFRLQLAQEYGLEVFNPKKGDPMEHTLNWTNNIGADVVFEVTGHESGAELMTEIVRTRGTICVVGIFSKPVPVNLFKVFLRELNFCGSRLYESCDFKEAIVLAASGENLLKKIVSSEITLQEVPVMFERLLSGGQFMKVLIDCRSN